MSPHLILVCSFMLAVASLGAELEWPSSLPPQRSPLDPGETWFTSRLHWHQSLKSQAPSALVLLVSVVFPGDWDVVSSEFFVDTNGAMHRWIITPRDTRRDHARDHKLDAGTLRRIGEIVPKLPVAVPHATGARVIVSFPLQSEWVTLVYSGDALPTNVNDLFHLLDFADYGESPKNF